MRGRALLERSLDRRAESLSDEVAVQTGVPAHATHAITGIVGATMLGMLKTASAEKPGSVGQLPALLSHQMPLIAPYLNDRLLGALGLGTVGAFTGGVLGQLKAVSAHIEHPMPAAKPTPEVTAAVHVPSGRGGRRKAPLARVAVVAVVGARARRRVAGLSVSGQLRATATPCWRCGR